MITYELMLGRRPFQVNRLKKGESRQTIKAQIQKEQVKVLNVPSGWSKNSQDFTNRCLTTDPACRLGASGVEDLMRHAWFKGFDWDALK